MATKKEAYLFLSAMLRAREPGMLSRDKAERIIDTLKKQGRNAHYMEFFVGDVRYKNYLIYYWTLKGE